MSGLPAICGPNPLTIFGPKYWGQTNSPPQLIAGLDFSPNHTGGWVPVPFSHKISCCLQPYYEVYKIGCTT
jgi:hypothetical protein